jgi:hypothetical protein
VSAVCAIVAGAADPALADRPFAQQFAVNAQGDIALVGT